MDGTHDSDARQRLERARDVPDKDGRVLSPERPAHQSIAGSRADDFV
ncbi:MAG TPA: hypothetical protein VEL82_01695 [Thermoplasmata archaeon]|nr:hypothetical protein [Thermoplasmata archaeon]